MQVKDLYPYDSFIKDGIKYTVSEMVPELPGQVMCSRIPVALVFPLHMSKPPGNGVWVLNLDSEIDPETVVSGKKDKSMQIKMTIQAIENEGNYKKLGEVKLGV